MKIGTVIVTYNRLEKLKRTLELFDNQSSSVEYLVVLNNCSTDGTDEFLEQWKSIKAGYEKITIATEKNLGGSSGFQLCLEKALTLEADWIWVSDDDAYPELDAIEKSKSFLENYPNINELSAICSSVINKGQYDYPHRSTFEVQGRNIIRHFSTETDYQKKSFEINAFSYVGAILNKEKLAKAGLPNGQYFLWFDDVEHSLRLSKLGKIIVVPEIIVHHDVDNAESELSWKKYYGIRNSMDMYFKHFPKKCFRHKYLKLKYRCIRNLILHRNVNRSKMYLQALKDFKNNHYGINETYKPGWVNPELKV